MMSLVLLGATLLGAASAQCEGGAETDFTNAADAVCRLEQMVSEVVEDLEQRYADINSNEGGSASCLSASSEAVISCDPDSSVWDQFSDATRDSQFNNPTTGSCTRLDANIANNYLNAPLAGRVNSCQDGSCDQTNNCQENPHFEPGTTTRGNNNDDCKCVYDTVYENGGEYFLHYDTERKEDYLLRTGCIDNTDDADLDLCVTNRNKFGISLPEGVSETNSRVQSEICGSNSLVDIFNRQADDNPQSLWQFMGFQQSGMYRIWPSVYECRTENVCDGCSDPRFRGWYAAAASGPKDVVMVLDTSGSMGQENRIGRLKEAARWVVNTLTVYDYFTVVRFASTVESPDSNDGNEELMLQATPQNKARLIDFIEGFQATGGTSMDLGLERAFQIMEHSRVNGATSGCSRIVMFLTDGVNGAGRTSPSEVIAQRNTHDIGARVFTYSLGSDADTSEMKSIACSNNGVWQLIDDADSASLREIMARYYTYLAAGVASGSVRWTDWFEDGEGVGQTSGVCSAVFDRFQEGLQGVPVLFGVVCTAIHRDIWENLSGNEEAWEQIQAQDRQCPNLSLTEEELEILRGQIGADSVCAAASGDDDESSSSGSTAIIAGAVGGVAAVVALMAVYCFCCKGKDADGGQQHQPPAQNPNYSASAPPPQGMEMQAQNKQAYSYSTDV